MFDGRWGEADLANPDFPALARAFGARGERLAGVDALGGALKAALAADGPTVLELRITVDPPWEIYTLLPVEEVERRTLPEPLELRRRERVREP